LEKYLIKATKSIFEDTFNMKLTESNLAPNGDALFSHIDVIINKETFPVFLCIRNSLLLKLSVIYFGFEDDLSKEDLEDFLKEVTNLIMGKVSMLMSDDSMEASIGIPSIKDNIGETRKHIREYFEIDGDTIIVSY